MKEAPLPSSCPDKTGTKGLLVSNFKFLGNGPYNLKASSGECLGLTGQSGVGKTQFLRAIADVIAHEGNCSLDGNLCSSISPPEWRRMVALLPAESFWWYDTVGEHLDISNEDSWLEQILSTLGFSKDVFGWEVSRLSTGERQRLSLVRTLINKPRVLLLDEPTSGLDKQMVQVVEDILRELCVQRQMICLWVSHDLEQLSRVASKIFRVETSGLVAEGDK
ncbi:MAG: ATP-binding cassette domain-containing protein [Desulfocapsa sp.]|nr:ATP-binding cassette domain-containing protein [Desulfocapsa sp.]